MTLYRSLIDYLKTHYPTIITLGRLTKWVLTTLKNAFFGIGGISLLIIAGLYIAGALIEPARWYLVGIASALLLLGGGLLALFYARLILNRIISDQRTQVSDIRKKVSDIKSDINKQVSGLKKDISQIKDDVSLIGYDLLKEQNKLAEKVSQLESQASNDKMADQSPNDSVE